MAERVSPNVWRAGVVLAAVSGLTLPGGAGAQGQSFPAGSRTDSTASASGDAPRVSSAARLPRIAGRHAGSATRTAAAEAAGRSPVKKPVTLAQQGARVRPQPATIETGPSRPSIGLPLKPSRPAPSLPAPTRLPVPAQPAVPPPGNQIMHVADVKPGMKGYGLTTFHGTTLERFNVQVVGVMPNFNMGRPVVLVRMSGGPITERNAFLIHGMSGSPVYLEGKLLGAFAFGEAWPKEPLGMITPVEDMLDALDPKLSDRPAGYEGADLSAPVPGLAAAEVPGLPSLFEPPAPQGMLASGHSFQPLSLPVMVSGFSGRNLQAVGRLLQPFNMDVMQGPGRMEKPFKEEVIPGAQIGVALMTGDLEMGAYGTVTYRDGDRILVFGHPFLNGSGIGAGAFPLTTAWVHDIFPGFDTSHVIASSGELVGTLTQDRPFSVAGRLGSLPKMVPIAVHVSDKETGRERTYHMQAANHPLLVGQLLPIAVDEGLFRSRPVPGDTVAKVKLSVETEGAGTITRDNIYYDANAIDLVSVRELSELMGLLAQNAFRRVPVKNLNVDVTYEQGHPTAAVERIFLPQEKFQPGEEVTVGVEMRPYRKDPFVMRTRIRIPDNASNGRALLMVQGGSTRVNILPPPIAGASGLMLQGSPPPDASLTQVLKKFSAREHNNEVVTRLLFPTTAVNVKGERLSQLPSTIVDVMRSSKTTGLRLERDEAKATEPSDYICGGLQTLEITIEKASHLEKPRTGSPRAGAMQPGGGLGVPPGPNRTALSGGDDLEAVDDVRFTVDGQERSIRLPRTRVQETPRSRFLTPEEGDEGAGDPGGKAAGKAEKPAGDKQEPQPGAGDSKPDDKKPAVKKPEEKKPEEKKPEEKKPQDKTKKEHAKKDAKKSSAGKPDARPGPPAAAAADKPPADTSATDDKLVGRQALLWTQTTQADFERGTLVNASVSTSGDVRLSPGLKQFFESNEQYVWSVLGMNGAVYAGTGNNGLVYKVTGENQASVFLKTGELEVHSLARDKAGNLYAGTSPNGKIFRVGPDGKSIEVLAMNPAGTPSEAGGRFVLSMVTAEDGTLYAGTGPEGKIYRLAPGAAAAEVLATLPTKSVMSLLLGRDGKLFAGTAEDGAIYRVDPSQPSLRPVMVYDTDQAAITGLAMDAGGSLYAACAPSGEIFKIERDGTPRVHFEKARAALYGLAIDAGGNLYTASTDSILRVEPSGAATLLSDPKKGQFTCLGWDDTGHLVAGSVNVGGVYRLVSTTSGTFESTIHDAKAPARWGRVRYTGVLPDGGSIKVETRTGNSPEPDATWSAWEAPVSRDNSVFVASPPARFIQYRAVLEAQQGTPTLRDITISYLPANQPPKLTLAAPAGGEIWKGVQTLKWSAVDPDGDTLTYELAYSSDNGRTWKPVGETTAAATPASGTGPGAALQEKPSHASAGDALERYKKELDADGSLTAQQRVDRLQRAKTLIDNYLKEHPDDPAAQPAKDPVPAPAPASRPKGVTRAATMNWDTKQVPDGIYVLRIIASDRASNPGDALSDIKVTEPFIVSNTAPQLFVFEKGVTVDEKGNAQVVGFVAARVAIRGCQYRLGQGDWEAIDPEDGIWDSAFEHFRFTVPNPGSGEQTVEVKVVDAAGNVQTAHAKYKVP